jgi:hypothetical protein
VVVVPGVGLETLGVLGLLEVDVVVVPLLEVVPKAGLLTPWLCAWLEPLVVAGFVFSGFVLSGLSSGFASGLVTLALLES